MKVQLQMLTNLPTELDVNNDKARLDKNFPELGDDEDRVDVGVLSHVIGVTEPEFLWLRGGVEHSISGQNIKMPG